MGQHDRGQQYISLSRGHRADLSEEYSQKLISHRGRRQGNNFVDRTEKIVSSVLRVRDRDLEYCALVKVKVPMPGHMCPSLDILVILIFINVNI